MATVRGMANKISPFSKKLIRAREKRNWTVYAAATEAGVGRESLLRLEDGRTDPEKAPIGTVMPVVGLYWPDIQLSDWIKTKGARRFELYVKEK